MQIYILKFIYSSKLFKKKAVHSNSLLILNRNYIYLTPGADCTLGLN